MVGVGLPNTTIFYAVGHLGPVRGGAFVALQPRPAPNGLWRIDIDDDECGKPAAHGEVRPPNVTRLGLCRPRRKRCFGNAASLRIGGTEVVGGVERAEGPSTARDDHRRPAIRGLA